MPLSRREFLTSTGATVLAGFPALRTRLTQRPDVIIRNGVIYDGTGSPGVAGDLVITGGRITAVGGRAPSPGNLEIDARNLAVAPGFVDIHSHADSSLARDPRAESVIRQGVTTIVGGQDGSGGVSSETNTTDIAERVARIDSLGSAVNVAYMIGLGSLRGAIVGSADRAATPDEIRQMAAVVESAVAAGAVGASSGLEYTPGAFARLDELIALCRPLAARRLPYATHMRNEDDRLLDSIDESIAVARGAGCPLQISHLKTQGPRNWPKLDTVFARIESAVRAGMDVTFDRYPYTAYATSLSNLFPVWSREGGSEALLRRAADPATGERVKSETLAKVDMIGGWNNVLISSGVAGTPDSGVLAQRVGTYASQRGEDPYVVTLRLVGRGAGMVGFAMSEENLDRILAHPRAMVCSDGGGFSIDRPPTSSPHPRGLGTFPRVLGRYVRERKALTLSDAIRKMSSAPARRLRLTDRGELKLGFAADVVVFDPATIADRATYEQPLQYPVGIHTVIVNGAVTMTSGERLDARGGKGLKAGTAQGQPTRGSGAPG
jgi:N-acyl-D-amino-acid deacylase